MSEQEFVRLDSSRFEEYFDLFIALGLDPIVGNPTFYDVVNDDYQEYANVRLGKINAGLDRTWRKKTDEK